MYKKKKEFKDATDSEAACWPESSVGAQRQRGEIWVIVQVDRGDAGGQDVNHPDCHDAPVQPVLLVEGAVAHLRPIWRELSLGKETGGEGGQNNNNNKILRLASNLSLHDHNQPSSWVTE